MGGEGELSLNFQATKAFVGQKFLKETRKTGSSYRSSEHLPERSISISFGETLFPRPSIYYCNLSYCGELIPVAPGPPRPSRKEIELRRSAAFRAPVIPLAQTVTNCRPRIRVGAKN